MINKWLVGVAACAVLVGCDRLDPNSPLAQRKALFSEMMQESEDLGGMLRGRLPFNAQAFAEGAVRLDELSGQPWQHFPAVRDDSKSTARDEVWQQQERFQTLARELEAATGALREAASVTPLRARALAAPVAQVEQTCERCHDEFRAY